MEAVAADFAKEFRAEETILYLTALPSVPHLIPDFAKRRAFLIYPCIRSNARIDTNVPTTDMQNPNPKHQIKPTKETLQWKYRNVGLNPGGRTNPEILGFGVNKPIS